MAGEQNQNAQAQRRNAAAQRASNRRQAQGQREADARQEARQADVVAYDDAMSQASARFEEANRRAEELMQEYAHELTHADALAELEARLADMLGEPAATPPDTDAEWDDLLGEKPRKARLSPPSAQNGLLMDNSSNLLKAKIT